MNPKVTPDTREATICRTGYTKSIRPPKEITEAEKKANAAAYSYTGPLSGAETLRDNPAIRGPRTVPAVFSAHQGIHQRR